MRFSKCMWVAGVVLLCLAAGAPPAVAGYQSNPHGMLFRAVGWFRGKGEVTADQIKCEVPTVATAIPDGSYSLGISRTAGVQTIAFPDPNNPFADPCGVYLAFQNNMIEQAVTLLQIKLRFRIAGRRFPHGCRRLRRWALFMGRRINPVNSTEESLSGAPNLVFMPMLFMVSPQLIRCLDEELVSTPPTDLPAVDLVIKAVGIGVTDSGDRIRSNRISYHLNLRRECGDGRLEVGEECDPADASFASCEGTCDPTTMRCVFDGHLVRPPVRQCTTDADCMLTCLPPGRPDGCTCAEP